MARPNDPLPLRNPKNHKILVGLGAAAALLIPASTSQAEDPAPIATTNPEVIVEGSEVIEIWEERPDKPFDRDTEARLTGKELAEQGAKNLADALLLIPELRVRAAGRGGQQIDIRGARKGSIRILIDGIAVDDPYYGNFDISSIPVTDIVQIRVSTSPASPIAGTGGPGGVVEVHTRDAVGKRLVAARLQAGTLASATAAATARTMLSKVMALRVSASSTLGGRDYNIDMPNATTLLLNEDRRGANGTLRLEYRKGDRRVMADVWAQHRRYVVPPGEDGLSEILVIDGESAARVGLSGDDKLGKLKLQGRAYAHALTRDSIVYDDPMLTEVVRAEDLSATRMGVSFLANRPLGKRWHAIGSAALDSEDADVQGFDGMRAGGRASVAALATGIQFEDGGLRIDGAAGVSVPMGLGADPWPEFKLTASYSPMSALTIKVVGARKGRIPTLRERFRADIGNESLGPEHALFGEVGVIVRPAAAVEMQVNSYARRSNGMIRFDSGLLQLVNTGELDIRGFDTRFKVKPSAKVSAGVNYSYADAHSPTFGQDPLDHFPRHRGDAWLTVIPEARFGGTARARYVGEVLDRNETLPGYTYLSVAAFARFTDTLMASLRLDNIADRRYQMRQAVRAPGRFLVFTLDGQW